MLGEFDQAVKEMKQNGVYAERTIGNDVLVYKTRATDHTTGKRSGDFELRVGGHVPNPVRAEWRMRAHFEKLDTRTEPCVEDEACWAALEAAVEPAASLEARAAKQETDRDVELYCKHFGVTDEDRCQLLKDHVTNLEIEGMDKLQWRSILAHCKRKQGQVLEAAQLVVDALRQCAPGGGHRANKFSGGAEGFYAMPAALPLLAERAALALRGYPGGHASELDALRTQKREFQLHLARHILKEASDGSFRYPVPPAMTAELRALLDAEQPGWQLQEPPQDECGLFGCTRKGTTLRCGHRVCRPCLGKWHSTGQSNSDKCPTCRAVFDIREMGNWGTERAEQVQRRIAQSRASVAMYDDHAFFRAADGGEAPWLPRKRNRRE